MEYEDIDINKEYTVDEIDMLLIEKIKEIENNKNTNDISIDNNFIDRSYYKIIKEEPQDQLLDLFEMYKDNPEKFKQKFLQFYNIFLNSNYEEINISGEKYNDLRRNLYQLKFRKLIDTKDGNDRYLIKVFNEKRKKNPEETSENKKRKT